MLMPSITNCGMSNKYQIMIPNARQIEKLEWQLQNKGAIESLEHPIGDN